MNPTPANKKNIGVQAQQ